MAATIHGYTLEELLRLRIGDLDTPESALLAPQRIRAIVMDGRAVFEVTHRRKDGSEFPVEVTARLMEFGGGKCVLAYNRDITERKRAEAALHESEARWRFALDGAGDGLWDWNVETGAVFYSARWKSMLGYGENELGTTVAVWEELLHPEDEPGARASVKGDS